ncbi:MAG TPA: site-specific tyrosine recombinase XerD [Candidatus Margulisbacteria bacterium]|nr:site-specific tyrosine recombinase XerD [Candidatus Margulisiibacteriota bacterium]
MIDKYLHLFHLKNYAPSTIKNIDNIIAVFKNTPVNELTIHAFLTHAASLKPATKSGYLSTLKQFLSFAYPQLVHLVPATKNIKPLPKNIPSQNEISTILNLPDTSKFTGIRDKAILELLYATGIRRAELCNLTLNDLDLSKKFIRINNGKGQKDRLVPIASTSLAWLQKYLYKVRPMLNPKSDFVFLSQTGHRLPISRPGKIVAQYSSFSPHKFRHAFATHLLQRGMKEPHLKMLLGHTNLSTTQVYTKVTINDLKTSYSKYHLRDSWIN